MKTTKEILIEAIGLHAVPRPSKEQVELGAVEKADFGAKLKSNDFKSYCRNLELLLVVELDVSSLEGGMR